jgi:hypothetical protein
MQQDAKIQYTIYFFSFYIHTGLDEKKNYVWAAAKILEGLLES